MEIVFSGFKDETLKKNAKQLGYNVKNVTTKDTKYVIVKDPFRSITTSSAKVKNAIRYNIPIISKIEFLEKLGKKYILIQKY
jgi:hypothetical protein